MMAAAALIPLKPFGAKPPVAGFVQFSGLIRNTPTARKNRMIPTLSTTIALLVLADSLMPMTRIARDREDDQRRRQVDDQRQARRPVERLTTPTPGTASVASTVPPALSALNASCADAVVGS